VIWLYDRGGAISHTVKVDAPNESSPENGVFGNYGEVAGKPDFSGGSPDRFTYVMSALAIDHSSRVITDVKRVCRYQLRVLSQFELPPMRKPRPKPGPVHVGHPALRRTACAPHLPVQLDVNAKRIPQNGAVSAH
jgi:hypothetical protein